MEKNKRIRSEEEKKVKRKREEGHISKGLGRCVKEVQKNYGDEKVRKGCKEEEKETRG